MSIHSKLSTLVAIAFATSMTSLLAIADDEDSVRSWGPWKKLVNPAAGPQGSFTLPGPVVPGFGSGDTNQFTAAVVLPVTPEKTAATGRCVAGTSCGYAFITEEKSGLVKAAAFPIGLAIGASSASSRQSATPTLTPIPVGQVRRAPLGLPGVAKIAAQQFTTLTVNSDTNIPISESIANANVFFMGSQFWFTMIQGAVINGITLDVAGTPFAYGQSFSSTRNNNETKTIRTRFLFGESTGLSDLNALNAGNVVANYNGTTLTSRTKVNMGVDFGAGTWTASFNGGQDSAGVTVSKSSDNVNVTSGHVGFEARGTFSGANIVSTSVSAADASAISGTVNGSFYGGQAGVLAGSYDVTKTTQAYTDGTSRELFVTQRSIKGN